MSEQLLRDGIEIKRQQMREADLNRFAANESSHAVLETRFNALEKRAVDSDDLTKLKREMEEFVNTTVLGANAQQSKDMLGAMQELLSADRTERMKEQLAAQEAVIAAIRERRSRTVWWVLGIIASIIATIVATLVLVMILGRPA